MIIVNADDWGLTTSSTDAALRCIRQRRVNSVSAMVFMADSYRGAEIANEEQVDVGLHLNLDQPFSPLVKHERLVEYHGQIMRFLKRYMFSRLIYSPLLERQFRYVYQSQVDEFFRVFHHAPSHINGHHHLHLCANMIVGRIIPNGTKIRRTYDFAWPDRSAANRFYHGILNRWLSSHYIVADRFFGLSENLTDNRMARIARLAQYSVIELNTHPVVPDEEVYLMSDGFERILRKVGTTTYAELVLATTQPRRKN